MKQTTFKNYLTMVAMGLCLSLGAQGMDGPSGPPSLWGRFTSSVSGLAATTYDSVTHNMTQGVAHLQFSMASKMDGGSSVPAVNAFLEQEIVKEGFQVREFHRPLTEEEFNSQGASLTCLYVEVQRRNIESYLMMKLFYASLLREEECRKVQTSSLEQTLETERNYIAQMEKQINQTNQLIEREREREHGELLKQQSSLSSVTNSKEKGKEEGDGSVSLESMNPNLREQQKIINETIAAIESCKKGQENIAQKVKETKMTLEEMERDLKVNESTTLDEFLAPCRTQRVSYLFKQEASIVKVVPLHTTIDTYQKLRKFCENVFDLQYQQTLCCSFLREVKQTFPDQPISVYCMLGQEGHLMYAHITLDTGVMKVQVFEPGPSDMKTWFSSAMDRTEAESLAYFAGVAQTIGLRLDHSVSFLKHQILNGQDCGRFSTIYLLNHLLQDKDPRSLQATEVLEGLQLLEKNGFERFHNNPDPLWSRPIL